MSDTDALGRAREIFASAERVVVFSGAGLSAESGIATFRDEGGIWERFPPEDFAEVPGLIRTFVTSPDRLREFIAEGVGDAARAEPNAAHRAIADFERRAAVTVVTQNIDGLHREAGSTAVHELHGSLFRLRCTRCDRQEDVSRAALREMADRLAEPLPALGRRTRLIRLLLPMLRRCGSCRARMRPDIVFFGEQLPADAWQPGQEASAHCDTMLVVGTSAQVYPAALLPMLAHDSGAKVVVVTLDPDFVERWANHVVVGRAATVVPQILPGED
jgi:NAD-dependent deacetylase